MSSSHQCAGYVKDVSMEVKSAFFPPPTIVVPTLEIPSLKTYVYKFETERQVVQYYEEENRRRNAVVAGKAERQQIVIENDGATPSMSTQSAPTASPVDFASPAVGNVAPGAVPPPRPPISVLNPEPLWSTPPVVSGGSQRESPASSSFASVGLSNGGTSSGSAATRLSNLHGFEEFEATTTLFDLMELKSLDDRKELEKLLM